MDNRKGGDHNESSSVDSDGYAKWYCKWFAAKRKYNS